MNLLKKFLTKGWDFFMITILVVVLFVANLQNEKFLLGWDNLFPEANPGLNLERNLSGAWLEYRGLGLLDGMSFIANGVHTVTAGLLSEILPLWMVRYSIIMALFWAGGIGALLLIKKLLRKHEKKEGLISSIGFVGAVFYMLNLATAQMFFTPYEVFGFHFAFLPWLLWSLLLFMEKKNASSLVIFGIVNLLATPQAHVPTVFLVYVLAVVVLLASKFRMRRWRAWLKRVGVVLAVIFAVNAFWMIPYVYSFTKNVDVITSSTINLMATDEVVLYNKIFADFSGTALMRGFNLEFLDHTNGNHEYLMNSWRDHVFSPGVTTVGWIMFALAMLGVVGVFVRKNREYGAYLTLFLFGFLMMGNEAPVFSWIYTKLVEVVPFFVEAYRFVFTKFATVYSLAYSVLLSLGLWVFIGWVKKLNKKHIYTVIGVVLLGITYVGLPFFRGQMFYENLFVSLPEEYGRFADYMSEQPKEGRVLVLPMPSYWGWTNNSWGYRGSGWIWQIIEQPMTDRAFDPWSKENETLYKEFSYALNSQNQSLFEDLLNKYKISWILMDESIIVPGRNDETENNKDLFRTLEKSKNVSLSNKFDFLSVYQTTLSMGEKHISSPKSLDLIDVSTEYTQRDLVYERYEDSYSDSDNSGTIGKIFPLANLDSRSGIEVSFKDSSEENVQEFVFKTNINPGEKYRLRVGDYWKLNSIPAEVWVTNSDNVLRLSLDVRSPSLWLNNREVIQSKVESNTTFIVFDNEIPDSLMLNEVLFDISWVENEEKEFLGYLSVEMGENIDVQLGRSLGVLSDGKTHVVKIGETKLHLNISNMDKDQYKVLINNPRIVEVRYPVVVSNDMRKLEGREALNCDALNRGEVEKFFSHDEVVFRASHDGVSCDFIDYKKMKGFSSYVVRAAGENISGRSLKLYLSTIDKKVLDFERLLPINNFDESYVIWSTDRSGYILNIDTKSFGGMYGENIVREINMVPIQAEWMESLRLIPVELEAGDLRMKSTLEVGGVDKFGTSHYFVSVNGEGLLELSQGHEDGWVGYLIADDIGVVQKLLPWFFGENLEHVKVNGWANGFIVAENNGEESSVVIVYWPQYLEWLGLVLLVVTPVVIMKRKVRSLS